MPRFGRLCLVAGLAACSSPRIRVAVPGSEATVVAPPARAHELAALVERYEPAIIAMLGTRRQGPYRVRTTREPLGPHHVAQTREVTPWFDWLPGRTCEVLLGPEMLPARVDDVLLHELTHVHARGAWMDLPEVVQEGVASWVPRVLLGGTRAGSRPPAPNPDRLGQVLTLSMWEYAAHPERREIGAAAMWVAAHLIPEDSGDPPRHEPRRRGNDEEGASRIPVFSGVACPRPAFGGP